LLNVSWETPDSDDFSATTRYCRRVACYQCILHEAGFDPPAGFKVTFPGEATINSWTGLDPSRGLTLEEATRWFSEVWSRYDSDSFFTTYKQTNGRDWADDDLQNLLRFLTNVIHRKATKCGSGCAACCWVDQAQPVGETRCGSDTCGPCRPRSRKS
jgi:hypothetical protein